MTESIRKWEQTSPPPCTPTAFEKFMERESLAC